MSEIKTDRILLPLLARTAAAVCPIQTDKVQCCLRVYLAITAASGTGGLKVIVRGYDKATHTPAALNAGGAAAIIATGVAIYELMVHDAAPVGAVKETVGRLLPCTWDIQVTAGDASSYTYAVSCDVIPL